ncbi:DUF302 domain-containing protein [Granulicella sibirica]|uniref:Putative exported protein n=1 Tax=Granulicella sibirica TaxID=2479048 RepID=A0A4Q0T5H3_9BACT|nr:DUF302 domain-containing protein [Granulicella sibirica]RXH57870.1 putative exported protein [Granulicella sibirica]
MDSVKGDGLAHLESRYSVAETIAKLEAVVVSKGLMVLARIDHSGDAERAGLAMRPTQLLIFGNSKAGTPLMIAAPSIAIDLPLKGLAWEDAHGKVWLSYNKPEYLMKRHGVPEELMGRIAGITAICQAAVS